MEVTHEDVNTADVDFAFITDDSAVDFVSTCFGSYTVFLCVVHNTVFGAVLSNGVERDVGEYSTWTDYQGVDISVVEFSPKTLVKAVDSVFGCSVGRTLWEAENTDDTTNGNDMSATVFKHNGENPFS